ncbi:hypothetical protein GGR55DRAFT_696380 [Xylaria sp. FL0064]|nr:hypothetical protein GGR55DRAFT_696380 [Xylaria sp. FL0064]
MCKIIYYICKKCLCGYPRFTECCDSMHPPLIYCPKGTQFKFQTVVETECHLHPHHAPMLHLGADGDDVVLPVSPTGSGPVIEAVTDASSEGGTAPSRDADAYPTLHIGPSRRPTTWEAADTEKWERAPDEQGCRSNNYDAINSTEIVQPANRGGQSILYGGVVKGSSGSRGSHRYSASHTHRRSQWRTQEPRNGNWWEKEFRATRNNYTTRHSGPRYQHPSSFSNGYYPNGVHSSYSNAPFYFQYQPQNEPQYQYYPYQAAPQPPFYASSASTPPGCTYMPVQCCAQNCQHQTQDPSPYFHPYPNQTFTGHMHGDDNIVPQWNQYSWNTQGTTSALHEREDSMSEARRKNLEQLQRSNDAAYYNCRHQGNYQCSPSYEEESGIATEFGASSLGNTQPELISAEEAYPQRGKDHSRPRSLSEPHVRRLSTSEITSPFIAEGHSLTHGNHREPNNDSEEEAVVWSPSSTLVGISPLNASVQPATPETSCIKHSAIVKKANSDTAYDTNFRERESDVSIKREPDEEDYELRNSAEWTPTRIKADPEIEVKLCDIPSAPTSQPASSQVSSDGTSNPPEVPPNSPVSSLLSSETAYTHKKMSEDNIQSARESFIDGLHMPRPVRHWSLLRDESLDEGTPAAIANCNSSKSTQKMSSSNKSENIPPVSQKPHPNNSKTWSAVVAGRFVPSASSDPFPAPVTAPPCAIHETTPKDEQSAAAEISPPRAPQTQQELPTDPLTVLPQGRPILPAASPYPTPPLNSPASTPAASENSLEMLNHILERRLPSRSSLEPEDFTTTAETMVNSESESTVPPLGVPQAASPTTSITTIQPIESSETLEAAPPVPSPAAKEPQATAPRSWSQLLFPKSGGPKKPSSLKHKPDSNMDEVNWPSLGSSDAKKVHKRNAS